MTSVAMSVCRHVCLSECVESLSVTSVAMSETQNVSAVLQDSKRLSVSVLDTLLNKDDFHTSLIACCLEVVLVVYGLISESRDIPLT